MGVTTLGRGRENALDLRDPGTSLDQCIFEARSIGMLTRFGVFTMPMV